MAALDDTYWSVPEKTKVGRLLHKNAAALEKEEHEIQYIAKAKAFLVEESVVADVLEQFKTDVLDDFKTTAFTAMQATLSRADRTAQSTLAFADASDAPGIGSKSALEAAHNAKHTVIVKMRFHVIDPANLATDE